MSRLNLKWAIPIIAFICVWEIMANVNIFPPYLFPSFSQVIWRMFLLTVNQILLENLASSFLRVVAGFLIGSVSGILVGIVMGYKDTMNEALHPILSLLMPIPALGWAPLFMLWIGINEALPIALIFMCAFFPVLYNTVTGIRNVDKNYVKVARSLGASELKILRTIVLPLALPNILTGLRLEAGMAWRTVIAAEMVAIPTGIGALLIRSESLLQVDIIIVCLIILSVMCLSFENFFIFLEGRLTSWRNS
ncbi:ABC transporter permease [[Eubacterium] cellulosolvens]